MNEVDKKIAVQYGIKSEQITVFFYNGHKYDKLEDAIRYAKIDSKRK